MTRPITTLFMLISVDGKINFGPTDNLDFDKDIPRISGVKEGLQQYYDLEQETDLWSLNSGRVQQKMGVNKKPLPKKTPVNFVLIDNTHLTEHGVEYFVAKSNKCVIITSNPKHPAFEVEKRNNSLNIIYQKNLFDPTKALSGLYYLGCDRLTIQTGGTLNSIFLREKLIDYLDIVVAPMIIGGKDTPSLIDGASIMSSAELNGIGVLKLEKANVLSNSYLELKYKVTK